MTGTGSRTRKEARTAGVSEVWDLASVQSALYPGPERQRRPHSLGQRSMEVVRADQSYSVAFRSRACRIGRCTGCAEGEGRNRNVSGFG